MSCLIWLLPVMLFSNDTIYSHFLHSSYLGLLLSLENTILLSIPGPLNTLLSFSELLLSPPFSVLLYFSLYPNSIKNNLLFGTKQDVIRQLSGYVQKNKLTVLSFYSLLLVLGPRIITAGYLEDTAVFIHHLFTHFFGTHLFSALGKHCWIQLFIAWMWAGWLATSAQCTSKNHIPHPPPPGVWPWEDKKDQVLPLRARGQRKW